MAALMPDVEELAGLKVELQLLQQQLAQLQAAVQQKQAAVEQKQQQLDEKQQKLLQERGLPAVMPAAAGPSQQRNRRKRAAASAVAVDMSTAVAGPTDTPAAGDVAMHDVFEDPEAAALFALDMLAVAAEDAADTGTEAAATATPTAAAPAGAVVAAPVDPAAVAAAAAAAAAAQMPDERNVAAMPGWLLGSLQDVQLHSPSYKLVPLHDDDAGSTTARLRHVATATARLPNLDGAAAASAGSSSSSGSEWGLPLGAPRCFWLLGDLAKAESAKYKVSGSWGGCPVIHVDTPDEGVFGCCIALEHPLPLIQRGGSGAAGMLAAAAAAAESDDEDDGMQLQQQQQQRPRVWLRCWRPVAQDGVQQQRQSRQQQQGDGGEREKPGRAGWDWQVLVNGVPYPSGQGKEGLLLEAGDELTVQGVRLKLVATD
jgi:hypothetical protein